MADQRHIVRDAQAHFVTLKTVETQLGSCYRKLGISSRHQLAAALEAVPE